MLCRNSVPQEPKTFLPNSSASENILYPLTAVFGHVSAEGSSSHALQDSLCNPPKAITRDDVAHRETEKAGTTLQDILADHSYLKNIVADVSLSPGASEDYLDNNGYIFLKTGGILTRTGLARKDLSPQKRIMYKIHKDTVSKMNK